MHIRPWEIELLTVDEMARAVRSIDRYLAELKKGGGDGN